MKLIPFDINRVNEEGVQIVNRIADEVSIVEIKADTIVVKEENFDKIYEVNTKGKVGSYYDNYDLFMILNESDADGDYKFTTRYIATILKGDMFHKAGERHVIPHYLVDLTIKDGLRIELFDNVGMCHDGKIYHWYPVSIEKVTYELTQVKSIKVKGGDRTEPSYRYKAGEVYEEFYEPERDRDY